MSKKRLYIYRVKILRAGGSFDKGGESARSRGGGGEVSRGFSLTSFSVLQRLPGADFVYYNGGEV